MGKKHQTGVIHGRFQPFHIGHMHYARLCFERVKKLIIGITNPDPRSLIEMDGDNHRHLEETNPFTYYERHQIISAALQEEKIKPEKYTITPFPIDNLEIAKYYLPENAIFYLRDRGAWTSTKIKMLEKAGYQTEILEDDYLLNITASNVRQLIQNNQNWKQFVSKKAADIIKTTRFYDISSKK